MSTKHIVFSKQTIKYAAVTAGLTMTFALAAYLAPDSGDRGNTALEVFFVLIAAACLIGGGIITASNFLVENENA
jgi:hypothetical protein